MTIFHQIGNIKIKYKLYKKEPSVNSMFEKNKNWKEKFIKGYIVNWTGRKKNLQIWRYTNREYSIWREKKEWRKMSSSERCEIPLMNQHTGNGARGRGERDSKK